MDFSEEDRKFSKGDQVVITNIVDNDVESIKIFSKYIGEIGIIERSSITHRIGYVLKMSDEITRELDKEGYIAIFFENELELVP